MTIPLGWETVVVPARDVLVQDSEEGLVLLNLRTGSLFELDEVGASMWRGLERPASLRQVTERLAALYEADGVTLERDILALVTALLGSGLLETAAHSAPSPSA
jgi:hypothetical protein